MMKYVVGIDVGTTSSRAVVFDTEGNVMGSDQRLNPLYEPGPVGWLECDGQKLIDLNYEVTKTAIDRAIEQAGISVNDIVSISFTMFRCTMITRDKDGGFITPIIMWQDIRGGEAIPYMKECLEKASMSFDDLYDICAMPTSACLPSTKLMWTKINRSEDFKRCTRVHTTMGLLTKAFGADDYYDDYTNTPWLQLNDENMYYSGKLCDVFGIDPDILAPLKKPGEIIGFVTPEVSEKTHLPAGIPLIMGIGDQQSGVLGLGCIKEGIGYACGGTAGVTAGRSDKIIRDPQRKCYILGTPDGSYEMEGQANSSASVFKWFKDNFCTDMEEEGQDIYDVMTASAADSPPGARGLLFLPYMMGANTPNYDENARGTFVGLTLTHKRADLIRSIMEGVVFDLKDMLMAMQEAKVPELREVRVTGGIARSDLWNQIQADIYNKEVVATEYEEATVLGSGIIAAVGAGIYKDFSEAAANMVKVKKRYYPNPENVGRYEKLYMIWKKAFKQFSGSTFDELASYQKEYGLSE